MKKATKISLPILIVFALTVFMVGPKFATEPPPKPCPEGCTPGYWKNHEEAWGPTGFMPEDNICAVFFINFIELPEELWFICGNSLMDALKYKGGKGLEGAARIMLRHAVAALLNATHPDVAYPASEIELISIVNSYLTERDRDDILFKAGSIAGYNEWLCPLD